MDPSFVFLTFSSNMYIIASVEPHMYLCCKMQESIQMEEIF